MLDTLVAVRVPSAQSWPPASPTTQRSQNSSEKWQILRRGQWSHKINLEYGYTESEKSDSPSVVSDSLGPLGLYSLWNSSGQNTGVGSFSLLQGIFPIQGSNPGLLHCRWILYQLSHKEAHTSSCTWVVLNSIVTRLFLSFPKLILITEFRQKGNYFQNSWLPQMI